MLEVGRLWPQYFGTCDGGFGTLGISASVVRTNRVHSWHETLAALRVLHAS